MHQKTGNRSFYKLFSFVMLLSLLLSSFRIDPIMPVHAQAVATATPTPAEREPRQNAAGDSVRTALPIASQFIIHFKNQASENEKKAFVHAHGGAVVQRIDALHIMVIRLPNNAQAQPSPRSSIVESMEQDYYIEVLDEVVPPDDPRYGEQWALPAIGAPSAWAQLPANAPKVTVAVVDSGICASHPDLVGRITDGWDFIESDAVPQDDFGHGCSVSGVIAANIDNGIGIAGVAPNAQIMPLRVLNGSGVGSYSDVAAAIVYAADNGAQVINLSLGGTNPSSALEDAVNYAVSKGVTVVAAAGNNGTEGALYPAAYPDVIAVGSVDSSLQHSSFSNYGSQIDIWAPGRDILTTKRDGSYGLVSGTSFAAPYASGSKVVYMTYNLPIALDGGVLSFNHDNEEIAIPKEEITSTPAPDNPTPTKTFEDSEPSTQQPPDQSIIILYPKKVSDYVNSESLPTWSSDCARSNQSACLPPVLTVSDLPAGWQSIVIASAQTWSNVGTKFRFGDTNIVSQDMRLIHISPDTEQRLAFGEVRVMLASQLPANFYPGQGVPASTLPLALPSDPNNYVAALVVLNDKDYSFGSGGLDLQYIVTHEFGHVLGLPDIYNPLYLSDVMYWAVSGTKRELSDHDKQSVINIYGPISPVAHPQSPILQSPATNSTGISIRPTFDWELASGAQTYFFQLSKNRKFANGENGDNSMVRNVEVSASITELPFDLDSNTKYYWRVKTSDFGRNSNWSTIWQFTTAVNIPSDTTPPTGSWASPASNSIISSSTVTLIVNASDSGGSGVREVRWSAKWGGNWYGIGTDNSAPYSMSWNMCNSGVLNGDVELGFEVWDNANNKWVYSSQYSNYHITKNYNCSQTGTDTTPPSGTWSSPGNNSTINSSTVTLNVNASDNSGGSGVREVRWSAKWNNQWFGIGNHNSAPYSIDWNMCSSGVPNGDVELGFEVWDNANNKWVYSEHYTNYHINKNYNCGGNDGGGGTNPGGKWHIEYWMNKYLAGYVNWSGDAWWDDSTNPYLNFDWGTGGPVGGWGGDEFSGRFVRTVYFPGGSYEFQVFHDDGAKLFVDNELIRDVWWDSHGWDGAWKDLSQGNHTIKVEYYENQGDAALQVRWYGPGYPRPDNDPPDGKITSPTHLSATNATTLNISADAWDDASGVDRVDFYAWYCYLDVCDWRKLGTDSDSPYIYTWNWGYLPDLHVWLNIDIFDKTGKSRNTTAGWVEVDLDRGKPTASFTSPASNSYLNLDQIPVNVTADDSQSGVSKVQFFAGYNEATGTNAQGEIEPPLPSLPIDAQAFSSDVTSQDYWHEIGWDENGADGWSFSWNAASVPDQGGTALFIYAYDKAGNYQGAQVWPVMLDRATPSSAVDALPLYKNSTSFSVSWTGNDNTSGIAGYDIQYQDNGGSWINWLSNTTLTSSTFSGVFSHTYAFRSRARDRAGNVEAWSDIADSETTIVMAPSNDNFASAIQITSVPVNLSTVDTRGATSEANDPTPSCGYGKNSNSVWYRYTPPASGLMEVNTWWSDFDTVLAIWTGTFGNLTQVACNDDLDGNLESRVDGMPVTAGLTYYIEVMDYGAPGGGNLELYVNFGPSVANDGFGAPITISTNPFNTILNTGGATKDSDDPVLTACNRLPGEASVWYRYTPTSAGELELDTKGSGYDTMLAVWTGTRGNLNTIGCNDDIGDVDGNWDSDSILTVHLNAGIAYYVEVSTYAGKIDVNEASANELENKPETHAEDDSITNLQDLKDAVENEGASLSIPNAPRLDQMNAQLWGGQLQLHAAFTSTGNQTLTVNKTGTGSGTVTSNPAGINCGSDCSEDYSNNTSVTLTATPASGSTFAGWSGGGCSGTGTCTITMNSLQSVTATFNAPGNQILTVTKTGTGNGTVTSNPAGINCGSDCSESYASNSSVTVTATPNVGSTFAGWSGACSGTGSCIVSMTTGKSVTATFTIVGNGADTTGVFRPINGILFLKNSNDTGFADVGLNYGIPGDYPVVGDWDGNGTATIGVYRNGKFMLRNSNTIGFADWVFAFGQPGDQPIAGDWDGDGVDTIGVYRPWTGQFLLRNSNDAGPAEMSFYLGNVGDVGIAGDWDGDGKDTTGVFRPSNGIIFLKNQNTTGFADVALNYGIPGDKPVTGDWDDDGIDTIGVYRNGQFMLRNSNTLGFADIVFGLGNPGDMPIAGNWDGLP